MAITLGSEIALAMHSDRVLSYTDIETALADAGFDNYTILRNLDGQGGTDLQIFVRDAEGNGLPASDTMSQLTDAVTAIAQTADSSAGS